MTRMPHDRRVDARQIVVGVDTHQDVHVAVALDGLGARLGELSIPTTVVGYEQLRRWAMQLGRVRTFGIEGTGSYGAGLARYLRRNGFHVVEVNRPDRAARYRRGKSDPVDAEAAARAVLAGTATAVPKSGDGHAEMIRMLKLARDSAVKARTQTVLQIKAILLTAPAQLREDLQGLTTARLLQACATLPHGPLTNPHAAATHALRLLAQRYQLLHDQARSLHASLVQLTSQAAPQLLGLYGVGPDTAAAILIATGDNPQRLRSEAAFAMLCGAAPLPASSGKTRRHRLNRGGDRQANAALHRITIVRLKCHEPTRAYMDRRLAEGKPKPEIIRCLKRYPAREIYHFLNPQPDAKQIP